MDRERLHALLTQLERGESSQAEVIEELAQLPFRQLEDARVDTHRALRNGQPEVVLGEGKTSDQIVRIARALRDAGGNVLVTRVETEVAEEVRREIPELTHRAEAGVLLLRQGLTPPPGRGTIAVVSAGTSDHRVAEEAVVTAELFGNKVERLYDVGVAGMHRMFASLDVLRSANVVIAIAGMEGALPSVVGGLVARPVIAVPTSVGYGASFGGVAALLGMLNSCASNVTVVNIDNGFGAAYVASLINR